MVIRNKDNYEVRYTKGYREYKINGRWLPSVTSIISQTYKNYGLERWKAMTPVEEQEKILKTSREVGELVHFHCIQYFINKSNRLRKEGDNTIPFMSQELPRFLTDDIANAVSYQRLYEDHINMSKILFGQFLDVYEEKITMLDVERVVYHEKLGFAGRYDLKFILEEGGKKINCLGDIKTSKRVYKESVGIQMSAYNLGMNNWAERFYVLRIHPYVDKYNGWEFTRVAKQEEKLLGLIEKFEGK